MERSAKKSYCSINEALLMLLFSLIKFIWFYIFVFKPEHLFLVLIRTVLVLALIYGIFDFFVFESSYSGRLVIHGLLAFILFSDTLYHSYFNILPSIGDIRLLDVLPDISRSIASVFKLRYLLLLVDIPVLVYYTRRWRKSSIDDKVRPAVLAAGLVIAVLLVVDFSKVEKLDSLDYYNGYGLMHYHISQLMQRFGSDENVVAEAPNEDLLVENPTVDASQRKYFGIAKGRNVIVIQVEAFQNFVVNRTYNGQEITPNINKLIKDNSIYYDRYYQQIGKGGTSDAEFSSLNSLLPSSKAVSYETDVKNDLYGLPHILKENGYSATAFHGYKPDFWNRENMYPVEGFDKFISQKDLDNSEIIGMGVSDSSFFKQSSEILKGYKLPFFAFLITLSSHHPYPLPKGYGSIKLKPEHENTLFGRYINAINYTDRAIGEFIDELKKEGLYDNTIIAIYGDHHALNCKDKENEKFMTEYLGVHYDFDQMFNVPLIIHIPGSGLSEVNSKAGGQVDLTPTLLNLLGIENKKGNMVGHDLNNIDKGFVALKFMVADGSYVDDDNIFLIDYGKSFAQGTAWKTKTREPVDLSQCKDGYEKALAEIGESEYILKNNISKKP